MNDIFDDSEKYKANLFLLLGTVLSTPFCILILEAIKEIGYGLISWIVAALLFSIGQFFIIYSFGIIINKDKVLYGKS